MLFLLTLPLLGALARDTEHAPRAVWWRVGALAVSAGLLRTLGLVGHSTETADSTLGAVADFVHVAAIAAWIGGLVLLAAVVLPRRRPEELAAVVPRFSNIAKYAVGTIVVAGGALTWVVVGGLDDLVDTHYGRVLLLKLAILTAVLVAAWFSKRWVDARLRLAVVLDGDVVTVRPFVVSVAAEVVLAVALLAVASVLVSTSPGT
jgi:copper transport protein